MEIKTNIKGGIVYEVKQYKYVVAGKVMADIEILVFGENSFGNQAKIYTYEDGSQEVLNEISTAKTYESEQLALNAIVMEVEKAISNSKLVKEVSKHEI